MAYNWTCGDGVTRPFKPVPNTAGQLPGPALAAVRNVHDFLALTPAQVNALADFYGLPAAAGAGTRARRAEQRKRSLKLELGLLFP